MEKKRANLGKDKFKKFHFSFKKFTSREISTYLIILASFIGIWFTSTPGRLVHRTALKEGSIAQNDIYADLDFWAVDVEETEAARNQKIAEFYRPVCNFNPRVRQDSLDKLFRIVKKSELSQPQKEKINNYLKENYPQYIVATDFSKSLQKAGKKSILIIKDMLEKEEIKIEEITDLDKLQKTIIPFLTDNSELKSTDLEVIKRSFMPTLSYNLEESDNFRKELINSVPEKKRFLARGENIVRKGDKITAEHLRNLEALNKSLVRANLKMRFFGIGLLILIVLALIVLYLYNLPSEFIMLHQYLGVLVIITIGLLSLANLKLFRPIFIPVASGAMLIALLLSTPLAIAFAFFISIFTGNLAGGKFDLLVFYLLGALAGILAVRRIRQRLDLFKAVIPIGLVNMGTLLSFGLINNLGLLEIGREMMWGLGNGLLCAVIVTGISPIFESLFKITSDINLLELSDLNRPILRRLMIEASGTYHHSLIVGNLAEGAAEKIKANSLLARVGSYYHDIGKLYKPEYFSENQAKSKSRHDKLTPRMSNLVIAAHIKEGVALAKENKLPKILIDFIEQHHGTTLMWIFYQAALEKKGTDEIKEEDFRYPGPKPQSREIAIVMLADAVEAASRTLEEPTPSRIRNLVNQIINDKFLDAQLEECNLTLRDLHEIEESFVYTLTGLFHVRVEYPQSGKKNNDRRLKKKTGTNSISLGEKNRSGNSEQTQS